MPFRKDIRCGWGALAILAAAFIAAHAHGDSITIDGKTYSDVLIYETSLNYYIKIPAEGRVFSIPRNDVDPDSVNIRKDFSYRRQQQNHYEAVVQGDQDAARKIVEQKQARRRDTSELKDLVQQARNETGGATDGGQLTIADQDALGASSGGAGGAGGLGITHQMLASMLQAQQFTVSEGPPAGGHPTTVAKLQLPQGSAEIVAEGPPSGITRMTTNATVPAAMMKISVAQVTAMISQTAPSSGAQLQSQLAQLENGGSFEVTEGGVHVYIETTPEGANMKITSIVEVAK